jgi:hypothetical protein
LTLKDEIHRARRVAFVRVFSFRLNFFRASMTLRAGIFSVARMQRTLTMRLVRRRISDRWSKSC